MHTAMADDGTFVRVKDIMGDYPILIKDSSGKPKKIDAVIAKARRGRRNAK